MEEALLWCVCVCGGGFCQSQIRGFAPIEGQIKSERLSQHTAASRDPEVHEFVLMQENDTKVY